MKTNLNMTKICFLALTWLFLSVGYSQAQNAKKATTEPQKPNTISQAEKRQEMPAAKELENFKPDNSDPVGTQLKYELLKFKAQLEQGLADKSLSQEDVSTLRANISKLEGALNERANGGQPAVSRTIKSVNEILVTDGSKLKTRDAGKTYITLAEFNNAPAEKQQTILSYHESYVIVKDASMIPPQTMSREEYNQLSPERKKRIDQAPVKIAD